jgi:hypothetical protein
MGHVYRQSNFELAMNIPKQNVAELIGAVGLGGMQLSHNITSRGAIDNDNVRMSAKRRINAVVDY